MSVFAYIGLGSNMGDKMASCRKAIELLNRAGTVRAVSSAYCTEPVGYENQEEFVNFVVELETDLSPLGLLAACHVIEDELGRSRLVRWGPRTIDLDILLYGDRIIDSAELIVPHPLMTERGFVLQPLCEIAPRVKHPRSGKTASQLLAGLRDSHRVVLCPNEER